jgi:phosphatidylserine/phosphatidylglycerophosphate/cardiolipin synthase-like enzyme
MRGLLLVLCLTSLVHAEEGRAAAWSVYFSPHGGAERAVVKAVSEAQKSIFVQAYSFTNAAIAKALLDAHARGVAVELILDRSNRSAHYSAYTFARNAGIATSIDAVHAIAHNKVMIIDGETVITGSFNFTKAAEDANAENLLVLRSPDLAARYLANWKVHRAHAH